MLARLKILLKENNEGSFCSICAVVGSCELVFGSRGNLGHSRAHSDVCCWHRPSKVCHSIPCGPDCQVKTMHKRGIHNQKLLHTAYRPLQPTVGDEPNTPMRYREFLPSDAMKPYVSYYWVLWSETALHSPFTYRVVPDGCYDLVINCTTFERLRVVRTSDTATILEIPTPVEYFGIRFFPGCFHLFFPLPLKDLVNKAASCVDVWGNRLSEFESRLFAAQSTRERIDLAESFLMRRLMVNTSFPDHRLWGVLEQIYQQRGHLSFERNASTGISPRQLRRLFDRYIGISPKSFARIVRFQSVLHAMLREPKQTWSDLYFDFGYYDQAHFIREFKHFFGIPPMSAHFPSQ